MKRRPVILAVVLASLAVMSDWTGSLLAEVTGGMYFVVLLKAGPSFTSEVTDEVQKLQEAHLANTRRLQESGQLLLAGPFLDDGELRGMLVLKVATLKEARELAGTDPMVKAGRLTPEIHPWMGPLGIRTETKP